MIWLAIVDKFRRLTRREQQFLLWGGVAALLILGYGLVVGVRTYSDRLAQLDRLAQNKESDLKAISALTTNYRQLRDEVSRLESKIDRDRGSFSLLSFLETTAAQTNLRSQIAYIRPQPATTVDAFREISVEVRVENVTLDQVVRLLGALEGSPHFIRIKNLHLRTRFSDSRYLDATLIVATYDRA